MRYQSSRGVAPAAAQDASAISCTVRSECAHVVQLAESAERFRVLTDLSADWYWEQDAEFRFTYPPDAGVCARNGEDIIGKRRWELRLLGVSEAQWEAHKRTLMAHQPFQDFVYRVRVNGVERTVSVSGTPMFDASGTFKGYRGVGREITRADLLREALDLSEKRLHLALESGRIGIWERDVAAGKIYWSANVAPMLGLPQGLLVVDFDTLLARIHPDDSYYQRLLRKGVNSEAFDIEHRVVWPDGTVRWVHQRGDVILDGNGRPSRVIGIIEDITRWKDEEARRLRDAVRQRDALIREVHHRIKNGLQGVALLLRHRAGALPDAAILNDVIAQIQTIAVMHGLQAAQSSAPVTLTEILRAIARTARLAGSAEILLDETGASDDVEVAEGERVALALVLNELVTNAVKHASGEAADTVRIRVSHDAAGGEVVIRNAGSLKTPSPAKGGGVGLQLVRDLLPDPLAQLTLRQEGGLVEARLKISTQLLHVHAPMGAE